MRIAFFLTFLTLAVSVALWRGGKPERLVALVLMLMFSIDVGAHLFFEFDQRSTKWFHFLIDIVSWVALYFIAIRAHRIWTLVVAALQTASIIGHVVTFLAVGISPMAAMIMQVSATYPAVLLIFIGTARHVSRRKLLGFDPDWSRERVASN